MSSHSSSPEHDTSIRGVELLSGTLICALESHDQNLPVDPRGIAEHPVTSGFARAERSPKTEAAV